MTDGLQLRRDALVAEVQQRSMDQVAIWQQLPWWANLANGRTGWSGHLRVVHEDGLWTVTKLVKHGYYQVVVDCQTGALLDSTQLTQPAAAEDVLWLAAHPDEIDAAVILADLKLQADSPWGSWLDGGAINGVLAVQKENVARQGLRADDFQRRESLAAIDKRRSQFVWDP